MTAPSRYSAGRRFRDLKVGDLAYSIHDDGRKVYALLEQVTDVWVNGPRGGLFKKLSCYADGTPLILFGMWFRRASGIECGNWQFRAPVDQPRIRLYLELPSGIYVPSRQRAGQAAA